MKRLFMHHADRLRHSLQARVFLALTLIIVIAIPGTGYFCYLQARRITEKQMQQYATSTAVQISKRIQSFLSHHTYNVRLIRSFFENGLIDIRDDKEILRYFHLFRKDHPEFVNINFGDESGRFLMAPAQIPEVHMTFDPRVRPWYMGAKSDRDAFWTDVYLFASTKKPGMTVSVPIYGPWGGLEAVCGIDIDISEFSRFLRGVKIGSQGFAYIFENKQGRVIAHPGLVQLPWNPIHLDLLRTCLSDLTTRDATFGMSEFGGRQYFTALTDYPGNDWTVGVTLPVGDFLSNVRSIQKAIISLVGAGIFLSVVLSYLIATTIVRPLNLLKKGIDRISSGDLAHKVEISDPDIAASLASAFNRMAASLETSSAELKKTYAELAQKEKLAAVGQMTAGIAHEIKNPLGVILGSAQVVANPDRPPEMREKAARFIMDEVDRLNKTLTAFLDFAKPPSPKLVPVNVTTLLEDLLVAIQERYARDGYRFDLDLPAMPPRVLADREQLREVFWNIIMNAVQSMPDGGTILVRSGIEKGAPPDGRIPIGKGMTPDFLAVSISDQGCGMSPDQLKTIRDPFVSFRDNGIGLGLSIVSQIVKSHQAQMLISSTPGQGTRFKLLFPLAPDPAAEFLQEKPNAG